MPKAGFKGHIRFRTSNPNSPPKAHCNNIPACEYATCCLYCLLSPLAAFCEVEGESAENEGYQYAGISSCLGGKRYDAETVRSQGQSYKRPTGWGNEQPLDESYFYSHEFAEQ